MYKQIDTSDTPREIGAYEEIAAEIGRLVDEKNSAYGDSFNRAGEIMAILYPDGIKPDQYKDALAVIRIIDKLFRIANNKDAFGENPFKDITGYGLLGSGFKRGINLAKASDVIYCVKCNNRCDGMKAGDDCPHCGNIL